MKNRKHGLKMLLFLLVAGFAAHAQSGYAYFYFEGDQQTPFYVKVEGKMQPRLGKNHFIIPNLDAGYTHFQILFQKNEFPPQDFLLEVPKGGSRAFVLHKVNERQFALYDLQQKRYIVSGNKQEDDHAPVVSSQATPESGRIQTDTDTEIPAFTPNRKKGNIKKEDLVTAPSPARDGDRFLNGIELNSDGSGAAAPDTETQTPTVQMPVARKKTKKQPTNLDDLPAIKSDSEMAEEPGKVADSELPPVANTDCPQAMTNEEFEDFALRVLDRSSDEERLKFIKKVKDKHCFSTEQVRILANNLKGQSARYEVVKILYFHTSDQENYKKLEGLFNTDFLKSKFREIINPK